MVNAMKNTKKCLCLILVALWLLSACACGETGETFEFAISRSEESNCIQLDVTEAEFLATGIELGDSVDVTLSNGFQCTDVPVFDGYYVKTGEMLICLYPGMDVPLLARAQKSTVWDEANPDENTVARITLREKGAYKEIQSALSLRYENDPALFPSADVFANFREIRGGKLKEGIFYRSASPINNIFGRAKYANDFAEEYGITRFLDLSDNEQEILEQYAKSDFQSTYFQSIHEAGGVLALDLSPDFSSSDYQTKVASALLEVTASGEPTLIHCVEGKDRTGFVSMLLLALADGTVEEITADYMKTYENYYGITETSNPERYQIIVDLKLHDFFDYLQSLCGTDSIKDGVRAYLTGGGLTEAQVDEIIRNITVQEG